MKHARLYSALPRVSAPRVRSNSAASTSRALSLASSFFDGPPQTGPPPPNTRLTTHRLPIEARGEVEGPNTTQAGRDAPLALVAPPHTPGNGHNTNHHHPHPAQLGALLFPCTPNHAGRHTASAPAAAGGRAGRRRGQRYTLDVGAYGIPKRGQRVRAMHTSAGGYAERTDAPLAVQVGEDAYFVRENAMGVADGVGGWARVKHAAPPTGPSASALFARRLMHFCADEVDRASHPHSHAHSSQTHAQQHPHASTSSSRSPPVDNEYSDYEYDGAETGTEELLAAELDELADGLDVLRILERAYERTLGAHVVPAPSSDLNSSAFDASPGIHDSTPVQLRNSAPAASTAEQEPKTIPLLAGSSTALVAVLDYVPRGEVAGFEVLASASGTAGSGSTSTSTSTAAASATATAAKEDADAELTPVLKIAHVGDCMGMLVREGAVQWRSEEMWWRWNTPSTQTQTQTHGEVTPSSAAHLFTLPVRAGDIVILASDGLSDNLWDEDVLEEVGRVGRAWADAGAGAGESCASSSTAFPVQVDSARLRRRTLAGMLSEALCSRARRVATRRAGREAGRRCDGFKSELEDEDDTPFARRARETGRAYRGGKNDDISVIVAVIAPAEEHTPAHAHVGKRRMEAARAAGS
ncbi:phosphatase 2C-like domain-containing protein [Mycena alexandri]|uniref:Protein phosphatase n=1 Tax=Mycena alexandri TaxID=1745969 RepID=A0AAD6T392_9AGAR|nr:phosphatase 2C-like domain-containing protein [Mycena alexandri]